MQSVARYAVPIWLMGLALAPSSALGDAMVVTRAMTASTIAEIFVGQEGVRLELEIGPADLEAFADLLPEAVLRKLAIQPRPEAERFAAFFRRDWVIRPAGGEPLPARLVRMLPRKRVRRDEITGEPLAVQPDDVETVIYVEVVFSWSERPDVLTVVPPRGEDGRTPAASIGFMLYHDGVAVNDFRYLAAESTVDLDWEDPWYSRFRHRNLRRQNDAPLSVFLYVEPFEIRKEIVVRPKDLQHWIDLGLEDRPTIPVASQEGLLQQAADFLSQHGTVTVDGQPVQGTLDRIHFLRRNLRTTGVVDPPEDLDLNTATLGVIYVYPVDGLPQEATLTWDLFTARIQSVPAAAVDEAGGMPSRLSPDDADLRWKNFLTNPTLPAMMEVAAPQTQMLAVPVISSLCFATVLVLFGIVYRQRKSAGRAAHAAAVAGVALLATGVLALPYARASVPSPFPGRPALETRQAKEVLHALLHNVYRAFDRRDEGLVYDRLALSISGELLGEVYLQIRRSMELENQGGARVNVDEVELLEVAEQHRTEGPACVYRCRWTAAGSVGHWGHTHRRTNLYDASLTIQPLDGVWKITAIDLREQQRVDPQTRPQNR